MSLASSSACFTEQLLMHAHETRATSCHVLAMSPTCVALLAHVQVCDASIHKQVTHATACMAMHAERPCVAGQGGSLRTQSSAPAHATSLLIRWLQHHDYKATSINTVQPPLTAHRQPYRTTWHEPCASLAVPRTYPPHSQVPHPHWRSTWVSSPDRHHCSQSQSGPRYVLLL